jgi:hypothetical protein
MYIYIHTYIRFDRTYIHPYIFDIINHGSSVTEVPVQDDMENTFSP